MSWCAYLAPTQAIFCRGPVSASLPVSDPEARQFQGVKLCRERCALQSAVSSKAVQSSAKNTLQHLRRKTVLKELFCAPQELHARPAPTPIAPICARIRKPFHHLSDKLVSMKAPSEPSERVKGARFCTNHPRESMRQG